MERFRLSEDDFEVDIDDQLLEEAVENADRFLSATQIKELSGFDFVHSLIVGNGDQH